MIFLQDGFVVEVVGPVIIVPDYPFMTKTLVLVAIYKLLELAAIKSTGSYDKNEASSV